MDIISHGLWGGVAVGRKSKRDFWTAFAIGIAPDLVTFSGPFVTNLLGITQGPHYSDGKPDGALIPAYAYQLYNFSHSLVIFSVVFVLAWIFFKKPQWLLGAWGLHILVDIPSHGTSFFPTPFLWPLSNFHVDGINWGNPVIFFPNLILLALAYSIWAYVHFRKKNKAEKAELK
jgi:hypothetical protein